MKIVHVETGRRLFGGAQQVVWLLRGLRDHGVDNLLACPPGSAIDAEARRLDIPVSNIECSGDADLGFAWRLRRLVRSCKPDIVHCHSRRGADVLGGYTVASTGTPAVLSRRVDSSDGGLLARLRYRPYRKIIAISEHVASVLRSDDLPEDKLEVIRSAVDLDSINVDPDCRAFRREFDLPRDAFVIAMIAQMIPRKGHRFLLDVIPNLLDIFPGIRVLFFGSGPGERDLRDLVTTLNLGDTVKFAGFRSDLDEFLGCIDLVVHPAVREGLGVTMLKAAAARVPVLAFDTAGAREAVLHGRTGVLVPEKDVYALQRAIAILIDEPGMRADFGYAGRERMEDEFAVETMVERHLELYRSITDA